MKIKLFKKSLVCGMFLFFIGVSLTSCIGGYNGKMLARSIREGPTNFPILDNDYLNAYWSFDEGSGNIANDYSGHDYDGTIYGATWTTETISGSDYALDFDGNDDYVDLDSYSENLGFNKTDDLIFSFHFKSTSNDKGMIYSTSRSWGTNPETHIFLDDDGTIGFKIKVTSCGFEINSNDAYNDDEWHYVEIWYNGISCEPTLTIYVDNQFDNDITHWVCPFENKEFDKTKIGRRSHNETNYFEGIIDEFKIIKYPGGNEQSPPVIDGPTSGDPGVEYYYTFVTDDPEEDEIWLYIDWDDGEVEKWIGPYESGELVTVSHTWDENGVYKIKAKSKDVWDDSYSSYYTVIIGAQPPSPPEITGPKCGDPEVEYNYTFVSYDYEGDNVKYFIDWDDGNTQWTDYYESGEEITISHAWDIKGNYEIRAKAKDTQNTESNWSTYPIVIGNKAPEAPIITGETEGNVGETYSYTFNATDPNGDNVKYLIDWGDGSEEETTFYASGEGVILDHKWTVKGTYTITAKAQDIYGLEGPEGTLTVKMPINYQRSQKINQQYKVMLPFQILQQLLSHPNFN